MTGRCAAGLALLLACLAAVPARTAEWTGGVTAEYWTGARVDDRGRSLSRFALRPSVAADFGDRWRGELELRAEWAKDDTGLGSTDTYAPGSRPLVDDRDRRVEIDRAVLEGRFGASVLTLGKQTVPWGVLDGIQVTDRFDAVRRRDFLFTEVRPERLSRWGARLRTRAGGWRAELALALDVLAPEGYGEIIGGSQREDDLEVLKQRIAEHDLPEDLFSWYLDLRRYGSVPHAGFGLGLERTVAWICGLSHVRETIPFPRMLGRLRP